MREVLAAADHDYVLAEPVSKPKRPRGKTSAAKSHGSRRRKIQTRRYISILASALCVAAIAGIAINALTLQKRRHPAPLFARPSPPLIMKEAAVVESFSPAIPVPAPRPQSAAATTGPSNEKERAEEKTQIDPPAIEKTANGHPRSASSVPAADAIEPRPDLISQLLHANAHEPQSAPSAGPNKTVLAAQRALLKLGYVLKPDGFAGATTRQAIMRYERDHGHPSHGELTPTFLRQLSADAAIPIN